jgi:hypothetical protein
MKATTVRASKKIVDVESKDMAEKIEKVARALEVQSSIKALTAELNEIKEYFAEKLADGTSENKFVCVEGAAVLKTVNTYSVLPESIPELKEIFSDSYPAFVNEKTTYGASAAFKKLLIDADYKHKNIIRESVVIKTAQSVTFTPSKG